MSILKSAVKGAVKGGKSRVKGVKGAGKAVIKGIKGAKDKIVKGIKGVIGKKPPAPKKFVEGDAVKLSTDVIKKPKIKVDKPIKQTSGATKAKALAPSLQLLMNAP